MVHYRFRIIFTRRDKARKHLKKRESMLVKEDSLSRVFTTSTGVEKMAETKPAVPDAPKCARGPSGTSPVASKLVLAASYTPISPA
eukprot:SAG31_NODE_12969_length_903_cov_1.172886_1_plen_86_part_00